MTAPAAAHNSSSSRARFAPMRLLLLAAFLLLAVGTRGFYLGDTMTYSLDVAHYFGKSPVGSGNMLWEFGHLIWRPLGWALLQLGAPLLAGVTSWGPVPMAAFLLIAVSLLSGALTVLLWYELALEACESRRVAFSVAFGFACANAFLTYIHSGTPYVPGLFCVTASLWTLRRPGERAIYVSAALLAAAALLWFPYVLAAPGVLLFAAQRTAPGAKTARVLTPAALKLGTRFMLVFSVVLGLGFIGGAAARRIGSLSEARAWAAGSSHGWSQSGRAVRLVTGVPRAFLFIGNDGVLYKRFLKKDPYAPVTVSDLARVSLWKILAFGVFLAALLWALWRSAAAGAGWLFAAGALPTLLFAVFVFEPGSPERYFPAYPFLVLAAASVLRGFPAVRRLPQLAVAAFLACMVATNVYSMYRPRMDRQDAESIARLAPLRAQLRDRSLVALLTNKDEILAAANRSPLSAINLPAPLNFYDVLEPATLRILTWREEFASEVLAAWSAGGDAWVSRRLWNRRPLPAWNWAEGDDPHITWDQIPAFFASLHTDAEVGGADGFVRLARDPANQVVLTSINNK